MKLSIFTIFFLTSLLAVAQQKKDLSKENPGGIKSAESSKDVVTQSKMDKFNAKAEKLFVYIPVPIISYTQETGNNIGLAKFNMINFYKNDTITTPSKISALATVSTLGNIKTFVNWKVFFKNDQHLTGGRLGYRFFPEYIVGQGNKPSFDSLEQITNKAYVVNISYARQLIKNNFFGIGYNFRNFVEIQKQPDSFLTRDNILGNDGGRVSGLNFFYVYDNRKNRYTPSNGMYFEVSTKINSPTYGSDYKYIDFSVDARKYFKVFKNHVIATQAFWGLQSGDIPYFDLYKLGGDSRMRGYYLGGLRDANIFDVQIEYRMPIWNIFGATAWVGKGKVYGINDHLDFKDLWTSYGVGLRVMVDSKSKTNLRFDLGINGYGSHAFIINFSEAF